MAKGLTVGAGVCSVSLYPEMGVPGSYVDVDHPLRTGSIKNYVCAGYINQASK
jgi:hypothetical protein